MGRCDRREATADDGAVDTDPGAVFVRSAETADQLGRSKETLLDVLEQLCDLGRCVDAHRHVDRGRRRVPARRVVRRADPAVRIARVTKRLDGSRAVIVLGDDVEPGLAQQ